MVKTTTTVYTGPARLDEEKKCVEVVGIGLHTHGSVESKTISLPVDTIVSIEPL